MQSTICSCLVKRLTRGNVVRKPVSDNLELLQLKRHVGDHRIELRENFAGVLGGHVTAELEGGANVEVMDHHAISAVCHHTQQFAGLAENQVTPRGIEFAEKTFQEVPVQFHVFWRGQVQLKLA